MGEREARILGYVRQGWTIDFSPSSYHEFHLYSPTGEVYDDHTLTMHQCSYCDEDDDEEICIHEDELIEKENEAQTLCALIKGFPLLDARGEFAPSCRERIEDLLRKRNDS